MRLSLIALAGVLLGSVLERSVLPAEEQQELLARAGGNLFRGSAIKTDFFTLNQAYFAFGVEYTKLTEIATESGCVQAAVPLVKSRRCMVILRLP